MTRLLTFALAAVCLAGTALAGAKFGPDAKIITDNVDYFRRAQAVDYWSLSPFYNGQRTVRGSSAAAAAMAVNALRGVPPDADDTILGPADLLQQVADQKWTADVGVSGNDVAFADYLTYLKETMVATALGGVTIEATEPKDAEQLTLDNFRKALSVNEASANNVLLVYFDRGVVTDGPTRPHYAPVGAYDAINDLVLIMDVDRAYYVPYWVPATTLLVAMFNQFPSGTQKGKSGGYFLVTKP
ncbi:MAG: phytochelatin synthase family protein [Bauldia sp.]